MLLDIADSTNYMSYNKKLAHIVGLKAAIYCSELLSIYTKAYKKNKLINDTYIKVDRKYIENETSLSIEDQLVCDINLGKINIIKKSDDNPDILEVDIDLLVSLVASSDLKLLEDIEKKVNIKAPKGIREAAKSKKITDLKNTIVCSDYELLTALRDWVEAIYSKPGGYLSEPVIKLFQQNLNNYTKGDLDLALRIVHIATAQSYKECQWAINVYEEDKIIAMKHNQANISGVRVTPQVQVKADPKSLSNEVF